MKKLFLLVCMAIVCFSIKAQTILLEQDFSTASGTTPPAGWTIQVTTGDPIVDVWHFDNPGRREPNSPIVAPFAIFDSDRYSDNGLAEEVYLTSPAFDATTSEEITLEFDQYFLSGYSGSCAVEVFTGSSWISIYSNSSTTSNPQHSVFSITGLIQNISNAQIRFKWIGNYSRYWIIDNIKISTPVIFTEQFSEQTGIVLDGVSGGSAVWGDYDNDGDLDILLTGYTSSGNISKIYRNNADNSFTEISSISLPGVFRSSVAWGDYDNDGDLDFLLTGAVDYSIRISKIYRNNGDNSFTEQVGINLTGVEHSSVAWGDYDNDGDLDILLTGYTGSESFSKVYRNNGNNSFLEQNDIVLPGVYFSSAAWGDYDVDGDLDILLTGNSSSGTISRIYLNNGDNSFTWQTDIALAGVSEGSVAWGDYDVDGDLDILLTGYSNGEYISKIYRNNGDNSFTGQTNISLPGVYESSVAWGDYDNDGDLDILLTGNPGNTSSEIFSKIYRNNSDNSFTEQTNILLPGICGSSVAWGDYDNDGDLDILLTGNGISTIIKNNNIVKNTVPAVPGNLNAIVDNQKILFSWDRAIDSQTTQAGLSYNLVVGSTPGACDIVASMSNTVNGFREVVQSGNMSGNNFFAFNSSLPAGTYYWGVQTIDNAFAGSPFTTGTFVITNAQASDLKFKDITTESLKINWTRGNKEKCAVFIKQDSIGLPVLLNNTSYTADTVFTMGSQAGEGWYCVYNGTGDSVRVTGLYGSTIYKIMVIEYSGESGHEVYLSATNSTNPQKFYTQDQFSEQTDINLDEINSSSVIWGDYDNDGDLDILLTGDSNSGNISKIYRNNGDNTFIELTGTNLTGVEWGKAVWGDYDNDNYLDILLTGSIDYSNQIQTSKIYRNNSGNSFTEQIGIILPGVYGSSVEWGDYNNDGNLDILLTGWSDSGTISKIYRNNADNSFTEISAISLPGVFRSSVAWGDYDNDGDLDFLLTGAVDYSIRISKIYRNNGDNSFTEQVSINLTGVDYGSVAWGDYDSDGDLDILLTGASSGNYPNNNPVSKIYRNNGDNSFTEQTNISLEGVFSGSAVWGDYDNDGDLDILLTGLLLANSGEKISKIYRNNGNNSFTDQTSILLPGALGSTIWGDYDNDGDLDILLIAEYYNYQISSIYKNNQLKKNTPPSYPTGITAHLSNKNLVLSWDKAGDQETPQLGLTYNLRVGTTPGGCEIISPMSLQDGKRTIVNFGNVGHNTSYIIDLSGYSPLPENIYYSVQSIDNGFLAGSWSPEKSEVSDFVADFLPNTVCQKNEIQFEDKSFSVLYPITSYLWKFTEGSDITTYSVQNPIHTFLTSGTHPVELTITNSDGAATSLTKLITVVPSPLTDFTATTVCHGEPALFDNTTDANTTTIENWLWTFGDNTSNSNLEEPGTHGYLNPGDYNVNLVASASNGCSGSIQKIVTVAALPVAAITANAPLNFCTGDSVTLSTGLNPDFLYKWMLEGTAITDAVSNSYIVKIPGNYSVEVTNAVANCFKISDAVSITIQQAPASPTIITDRPYSFCRGDSVMLSVTSTAGYAYQWKLNGGVVGLNSNQIIAKDAGKYTVTVSNSNGCSVNSSNSVIVNVNSLPQLSSVSLSGSTFFCENENLTMSVPITTGYLYQWNNAYGPIAGEISNSFSATKSGQYSLDISNENGCRISSPPINVTVKNIPEIPKIFSENYIVGQCNSDLPIIIRVDQTVSEYNYSWKRNGITLRNENNTFLQGYLAAGDYTVKVDNDGCSNESEALNIYYEGAPKKPDLYVKGPVVWYMAASNDTASHYRWYLNDELISGSNKFIHVANKTLGTYKVAIANDKGCYTISDAITIPVTKNKMTDFFVPEQFREEDLDPFANLKIYPNPTPGMFTVEMDNNIYGELNISIATQAGKEILKIKFQKSTEHFLSQVDLSGQPNGMYIINLLIDRYMATRKVMVE